MSKSLKRTLSIILSTLILMSVFAVVPITASAATADSEADTSGGTSTVYLDVSGVTTGEEDFYAWIWSTDSNGSWTQMAQGSQYYEVSMNSGDNIIFVRVPIGETPDSTWSNIWNQTDNLSFDGTNNLCILSWRTGDTYYLDALWSAYDEEETTEETTEDTTAEEVTEGTTGDCTWSYDSSTGTLTISGNGAMEDYASVSSVPWYSYSSNISTVLIETGVTRIGSYAFYDFRSLISVIIPDSVTNIGNYAFKYCTSLVNVTIPDSVQTIGKYAFVYCFNLEGITIPDGVESIGEYAFHYCSNLSSVTIPSSVTSIGDYAFNYCNNVMSITISDSVTSIGYEAFSRCENLEYIEVDSNNEYYLSEDGVLYNKDKTELIVYPAKKADTSYTIPNSVTSISDYAFSDCTSLESITIPDSVTSIGNYAFYGAGLTNITIPDSVTSIGERAFYCCTSLENITISDSVTSIGERAFSNCECLVNILVSENNENYSSIDGVLFNKDATKIICYPAGRQDTSYTIPDSVTNIEKYGFLACSKLTDVTIPDSVISIGYYAFNSCTSLESVIIGDGVTSIGNDAFNYCINLTNVTIGKSVTSLGSYAFSYCTSLESITIPDSVTEISSYAFAYCSNLTSITIPYSVTRIGYRAFYNCKDLTIYGYTGSYAETYASENGYTFVSIGVAPTEETTEETTEEPTEETTEATTGEITEAPTSASGTFTLYYVPTQESVEEGDTYKVLIQHAADIYYVYELTDTGDTVGGLPLYAVTIDNPDYTSVLTISYQVFNTDGEWVSQVAFEQAGTLAMYSNVIAVAATGDLIEYTVDQKTEGTTETETETDEPTEEPTESTTESTSPERNYDYYIVGGVVDGDVNIFGVNWAADEANGMTKAEDGDYYLTIENAPVGTYEFKVLSADGISWYPAGVDNNSSVTVDADGATVIFRYSEEEGYAIATADGTTPSYYVEPTSESTEETTEEPTSDPTEETTEEPTEATTAPEKSYTLYYVPTQDQVDAGCKYRILIEDASGTIYYIYKAADTGDTVGGLPLYSVTITDPDYTSFASISYQVYNSSGEWTSQVTFEQVATLEDYSDKALFAATGELAEFVVDQPTEETTASESETDITDPTSESTDVTTESTEETTESTEPTSDVTDPTETTEPTTGTTDPTESTEPSSDVTEPTTEATEPTTQKTDILLNEKSFSLYVKEKSMIGLTVLNPVGKTTYKSSNKKIVSVSSSGKVTAKKKGTATITISNNGVSAKVKITVKNPKLNKKTVTLKKSKTFKLKVTGLIGKAKFKSNKKKVAKVNSKGKITAKKKGKATITVTANGVKLKCKVKVKK